MAKQIKIEIKLVKSPIGYKKDQKLTLHALGLKKINQSVIKSNSDGIQGMIRKISHLVELKELSWAYS